jgi:hypothetical protein
MTIYIPKPLAILLLLVLGGGLLGFAAQEMPDLIRYLKQVEGL